MMKLVAFVLTTLFVSAAVARPIEKRDASGTGLQISYDGNATLSNEAAYTFLATELCDLSFVPGLNFIFYTAIEGSAEGNSQMGDASADGIMGLVVADTATADPPTVFQMYFKEKANWDTGAPSGGAGDISVTGSASFAAIAYDSIEEVDAGGSTVATISLKEVTFSSSGIQHEDITGAPQALSYTTLYGTATGGATISVGIVLSEVIGHLNVGADVTPQSLETVLEVSGYKYGNEANHLRLNLIAGTGSVSGEVDVSDDSSVVTWGYGASAPYVTLCQTVDAGSSSDTASSSPVTVSSWTDYDESKFSQTSIMGIYASAMKSEKVPVKYVSATVDFPAGKAYLLYDPQTGFNRPNSPQSGAATLVPGLALLVFSVLASYLKF